LSLGPNSSPCRVVLKVKRACRRFPSQLPQEIRDIPTQGRRATSLSALRWRIDMVTLEGQAMQNQDILMDYDRPIVAAMLKGWQRKCPNCGTGQMLSGYLKVRDSCPVCGEDLSHQRADDGPAYLTILIVGHVMAPAILLAFIYYRPDPLVLASVFSVATVALSLYLLPRLKGVLVNIQWARRMHGFGDGD
jgi:uncharacterized protein (DUF983 family)